jgi:predicted metal-dependent peptidase
MLANRRVTPEVAMQETRTALMIHHPFWAQFMLEVMDITWSETIATAATNGKKMWVNPGFFASLTLPERIFLICHEIGHCMFLHMPRGRRYMDVGFNGNEFDHKTWNAAADYVINRLLHDNNVGRMPSGGLLDKQHTIEDTADTVYDRIWKKPPPGKGGGKQGNQQAPEGAGAGSTASNETPDGHGTLDTHVYDNDPTSVDESEIKRAVVSAAEAAKAVGKLPASLQRLVDDLINPQIPWQEKLRFEVIKTLGDERLDPKRINRRRYLVQGIIYPAKCAYKSGPVVVAIDTSGSISDPEMRVFLSELKGILADVQPEIVHVVFCDAEINSMVEIADVEDLDAVRAAAAGGGGTDFRPPFKWVEDEGIECDALIYLTDLCGPAPERAPGYPVFWCSTTDQTAPWGETLRVEVKEHD